MIPRFSAAIVIACGAAVSSAQAQTEITITAATVSSLQARLQTFRAQLSGAERDALNIALHAAARAPYDGRGPILITGTYVTVAGRATTVPVQSARSAMRDSIERAVRTAGVDRPTVRDSVAPSGAKIITVQGSIPSGDIVVRSGPASKTIIVQGGGGEASALRPADARDILHSKLLTFAEGLSVAQGATLDWLIQRATSREEAFESQLGEAPTLAQALGIRTLGRRGPGDRRPPPASFRAILRY